MSGTSCGRTSVGTIGSRLAQTIITLAALSITSACNWPVLAPGFGRVEDTAVLDSATTPDVSTGDDAMDVGADARLDATVTDVSVVEDVRSDRALATDVPANRDVIATDGNCPDGGISCNDSCVDPAGVLNCGHCGHDCSRVPGGIGACADGACVLAACEGAFANCNEDFADGCEASLHTDEFCSNCREHCGGGTHCVDTGLFRNQCCAPAAACDACSPGLGCLVGPGTPPGVLCCQPEEGL